MPPVNCPHCREELDIPDQLTGREVRCAVCQRVFLVPSRASQSQPPVVQRRTVAQEFTENESLDDETTQLARKPRRSSYGLIVVILGLLTCCGVGCGGSLALIGFVANPNFQRFDAPDGTFAAAFPGKPRAKTDTNEDGVERYSVEARRRFPPEFYFVSHVELKKKAEAETVLTTAADNSVKRVTGGIEMRRVNTTVEGYPAIDLLIEHGNGQQVTIVRHIVVGKRLYTLGIVGPQGLDFPIDYVDRFFSSFEVKQKP